MLLEPAVRTNGVANKVTAADDLAEVEEAKDLQREDASPAVRRGRVLHRREAAQLSLQFVERRFIMRGGGRGAWENEKSERSKGERG